MLLFLSNSCFSQHFLKGIKKENYVWRQKEWNAENIYKYQGLGLVQQNLQQQSFSQNQINTKNLHQSGSL
jgi:hypothetical protein